MPAAPSWPSRVFPVAISGGILPSEYGRSWAEKNVAELTPLSVVVEGDENIDIKFSQLITKRVEARREKIRPSFLLTQLKKVHNFIEFSPSP